MKQLKKMIAGIMIVCIFVSAGCGKVSYPDLPGDAIAFEMGAFEDKEHDSTLYGTIEYNGRTYIGYGTINDLFQRENIDECIGYIIQDEKSSSVVDTNNTDRRVYTLEGDPNYDFLMDYDSSIRLMNQPAVFRAIDTQGKEIAIPEYIDELGYKFWD